MARSRALQGKGMARPERRPKSGRELRRRAAFRSEPDRVLIVTEGSKTEPAYFRMLINELGLTTAKVTIVGDGGSAPISIVEDTQKHLDRDNDFEQIYCVFDRDRHDSYDKALDAIHGLARQRKLRGKTILAITSVPCFELWYLLHVSASRKPYEAAATGGSPAQALIADLNKHAPFTGYEKKDCASFFCDIASARDQAAQRAEHFLNEARKETTPEFHENPSTRVHMVIMALTEIARKKKSETP